MKVIVANLVVAGLVYAWWCRAGREWFATGLVFGGIVLVFGMAMGIWCSQPASRPRRKPISGVGRSTPTDLSAFDQLIE